MIPIEHWPMRDSIAIYVEDAGRPVGRMIAGPFDKSTVAWCALIKLHRANVGARFCAVNEDGSVKWASPR